MKFDAEHDGVLSCRTVDMFYRMEFLDPLPDRFGNALIYLFGPPAGIRYNNIGRGYYQGGIVFLGRCPYGHDAYSNDHHHKQGSQLRSNELIGQPA